MASTDFASVGAAVSAGKVITRPEKNLNNCFEGKVSQKKLILSPNAIAKAFNVMKCIGLSQG